MSSNAEPTAVSDPDVQPGRTLGLRQATALIVGNIIGVGIFSLPGSLSAYGPITLLSMVLVTAGALALALLFAGLSRRLPADGGPYAYSRVAFGNGVGFFNGWSYWIMAWSGNAAIVTGWVLYVEYLLTQGGAEPALPRWALIGIALFGPMVAGVHQSEWCVEDGLGAGGHHGAQVPRVGGGIARRCVLH